MADYYERKAKAYQKINNMLKQVHIRKVDELMVDDIIDIIVEDPRLAIGERCVVEKIEKMVKKLGTIVIKDRIIKPKGDNR